MLKCMKSAQSDIFKQYDKQHGTRERGKKLKKMKNMRKAKNKKDGYKNALSIINFH